MLPQVVSPVDPSLVLQRLRELCVSRGLDGLAGELQGLSELLGEDLQQVEASLAELIADDDLVRRSAAHLLILHGKRIRPLCVALAARVGDGFSARALDLAVAVELIHSATLLHDDVVDLADRRRGAAAARVEFGNAASIFAGDWLLVKALQRVRRASVPGTLDRLLETIAEMIAAESLQLENRGRIETSRQLYFQIAEGKSATLFRWAMEAGGRAGGLDDRGCAALMGYGLNLGLAFQVIDDLLDLNGDTSTTGKALFADLREGKMTYPLIVAVERDPSVRLLLEEIVAAPADAAPLEPALCARVTAALAETGAVEECRALARERATMAARSLAPLPENPATAALALVAESVVERRR